ncbi:hypothetical protein pb186bvf_006503 [Paramecium bursaria]
MKSRLIFLYILLFFFYLNKIMKDPSSPPQLIKSPPMNFSTYSLKDIPKLTQLKKVDIFARIMCIGQPYQEDGLEYQQVCLKDDSQIIWARLQKRLLERSPLELNEDIVIRNLVVSEEEGITVLYDEIWTSIYQPEQVHVTYLEL